MTPLALRSRLLVPALLAGALAATVLLGACSGSPSSPSASGGSSRPSSAASAPSAATSGTPAPDATGSAGTGGGSGGSGGGGSGVGNRDACKTLTSQDASSILGQPVGAGKDGSALGIPYPSCTYTGTSGFQTVGLTIFDAAATANLVNQYKQQFSDLVTLPGIGDAALSEGDGRLVVATKGAAGCVMLRAGDVNGSAAASTQLLANICEKVFAG
jgi:hypothetical protein